MRRIAESFPLATVLFLVTLLVSYAELARANALDRDRDPVILTGSSLPSLIGVDPRRIVAFRFEGSWLQIPVQIDERAIVDFGTVYNTTPTGYTFLAYTDTSTFTGPDPDATFDANDELVFMAEDAGIVSSEGLEPIGVIIETGVELAVTNPINGGTAFVYLFESDGTLDPGMGASPVTYNFVLLSGDYKTTYQTMGGGNPEDSDIATAAYAVHFSERWVRDETSVSKGGATGIDILDRHKNLFAPGNCSRSEDTFSAGEGAFICNITGPVRVIRGYVGCNSGPTTYRINTFYKEREDILTVLRVHAISGMMDFFDYSPAAAGMTYYNDLNTGGVAIDGVPDAVTHGLLGWEMVTGTQGTMAITPFLVTDIPDLDPTSYYCDDSTPPETQCTGDDYEYGASGLWIDEAIPNTDPGAAGDLYHLEASRIIAYGPPDQDVAYAEVCAGQATTPFSVTVEPWSPVTAAEYDPVEAIEDLLDVSYWPNPASSNLWIHFAMRKSGTVRVRLYDAAGRHTATLVDGYWGKGAHEVTRSLEELPAGVYFARAAGPGGARHSSRIVILR